MTTLLEEFQKIEGLVPEETFSTTIKSALGKIRQYIQDLQLRKTIDWNKETRFIAGLVKNVTVQIDLYDMLIHNLKNILNAEISCLEKGIQ
jgi:hypothetical protein